MIGLNNLSSMIYPEERTLMRAALAVGGVAAGGYALWAISGRAIPNMPAWLKRSNVADDSE
ncbi:MAG: hypothetical protein ACYTEQ_05170 [Planctomycetota bacterium]